MKCQTKRGLLVSAAALVVAAALPMALSGGTPSHATRAAPVSAPSGGCGAVSCTSYLPIVSRDYPPQPQFEVTQAVQQPDNSVPLVANRAAFVRLTLTSTLAYTNVNAWLHGARNGVPLPGSPVAALNNPRTLAPTVDRSALGDTFNFQLPSSWPNGTVALKAYAANPSSWQFDSAYKMFQFVQADPLHVTIVPIAYTCTSGGSGTTTPAGPYGYLTGFAYRTYPVPSVPTSTHASLSYSGPCAGGVPDPVWEDWEGILDAVTGAWEADGFPNSYYYGLVKVACAGGCYSGVGWLGGLKAAAGWDGWDTAHSSASETHAHEVGHNWERDHAPGCGAGYADPYFPYVSGGRGYIGDGAHPNYGFDINTRAIHVYATYYDLMGYCGPEWISDYTYKALLAYNQGQIALGSAVAPGDRVLMISGRIHPSSGQVAFWPAYTLEVPDAARLPDPGEYTIELHDASGHVKSAYPFAPTRAHADSFRGGAASEFLGFHMTLPYAERVASVRVRRGGAILGVLEAGQRAPTLYAGASTQSADARSVRVNWSGRGADGEALHYLVRASTDDGATWQTIGVNLSTPSIDLVHDDFGGQRVLVQVLASDGLRTTSLRLGPFNVP